MSSNKNYLIKKILDSKDIESCNKNNFYINFLESINFFTEFDKLIDNKEEFITLNKYLLFGYVKKMSDDLLNLTGLPDSGYYYQAILPSNFNIQSVFFNGSNYENFYHDKVHNYVYVQSSTPIINNYLLEIECEIKISTEICLKVIFTALIKKC